MSRKIECVLASVMPVCLLALALSASSAHAAILYYEMSLDPDAESVPMTRVGGGYGAGADLVSPNYGGLGNGDGNYEATGFARFVDSGSTGNNAFYKQGFVGAFTVDMRIFVKTSGGAGADARNMGVSEAANHGRAIRLINSNDAGLGGPITAPNAFRFDIGDNVLNFADINVPNNPSNPTSFHMVRMVVPNNQTVLLYDLENDTDAGPGVSWALLGTYTGLVGNTGRPGSLNDTTHGGIELNSESGGTTTAGTFSLDWLRINDSAALGATDPIIPPNAAATCIEAVTPAGTQNVTGYASASEVPFATVNLGSVDASDGLTNSNACCVDGQTQSATQGGRDCRTNVPPQGTNNFIYFNVDDARAFQGSIPAVKITFDYWDTGPAQIGLAYDSTSANYTDAASTSLGQTPSWQTATITITDAYFGNRENGGSDFRIASNGTNPIYLDNVTVTDTNSTGPLIDYTVTNAGNTTFTTWTVEEVNCDGTPNNYDWLSLSVPGGGPLAPEATDSVTATTDTTNYSVPQLLTGYLKFGKTGCTSASSCFSEPFTYSDGPLAGQGGWTYGTGSNQVFNVVGNQLRADGSIGSDNQVTVKHAVTCTAGDEIDIVCTVQRGTQNADPGHATEEFWRLRALDTNGNAALGLGFFVGTTTYVYAKSPADLNQTTTHQTIPVDNSPLTLEMKLHPGCRTVEYWIGGVLQNTYPWDGVSQPLGSGSGVNGILAGVQFELAHVGVSGDDTVLFDNLTVTPFSNAIIREIDLNVLGCAMKVLEPRIRIIGQCPGTSTTYEVFTLKNTGAYTWTGIKATDVTGRAWLSLPSGTVPVSVVPGATVTVTATIDWSQALVIEGASIKFEATCDGSNFVFDQPEDGGLNTIVVYGLAAPGGFKAVYQGVSGVEPDALDSAGAGGTCVGSLCSGGPENGQSCASDTDCQGLKFALDVDTANNSGSVVSDSASLDPNENAVDGYAYMLVDTINAGDKTKWRLLRNDGVHLNIEPNVGATIVARVKTTSYTANPDTTMQNLKIFNSEGIAASAFWGGAIGNNLAEVNRGPTATVANDAKYHIIRMTSQNLGPAYGVQIRIYVDENPTPALTLNNAGNSSEAPGGYEGIGFGADRSTFAGQTIFFDWITGTNKGVFAPGEEDDCIGSLIPPQPCAHLPNVSWADTDHDGDVDLDDLAVFQLCYTGSNLPLPTSLAYCACMDRGDDNFNTQPDFDGDIDQYDFNAFNNCYTGPTIPWTPVPECNNNP